MLQARNEQAKQEAMELNAFFVVSLSLIIYAVFINTRSLPLGTGGATLSLVKFD